MAQHPTIRIHAAASDKPAVGAPCNGCGICCLAAPCPVSRLLLKHTENACPALVWQDDTLLYRCGMLQSPARYVRWLPGRLDGLFIGLVRRWLALNIGCDSDIEIEPDKASST